MNHSNLLRRLIGVVSVVAIALLITFTGGCTSVDSTLGSDLTPQNQAMKLGQMKFSGLTPNGNNYFESRLYKSDSMNSAGLSSAFFGSMINDTFGLRNGAFFTQYISANLLDDDIFGYDPIFDSAVLYVSIDAYSGDTTVMQQFEVYEIVDNSFITESEDSIFFSSLDIERYLADAPIFTFTFPDASSGIYTTSGVIKMNETDLTADFIDRLMLSNVTGDYDEDIYEDDEEWVEYFKGIYIRPTDSSNPDAALYSTLMESSGFGFYGRNREEVDPTLIKDTIGMSYYFYTSYAEAGNVSINFIDHDYAGSMINPDDILYSDMSADDVPTTSTIMVEAMGGVVTQITFAEEFFEELDTILDAEEAETGEVYTSLFFNQAKLMIYMDGLVEPDDTTVQYQPTVDAFYYTPWMNYMPTNLGMYIDYSCYYTVEDDVTYTTLVGVADYVYAYESSYTLDFGGEMNRSWGCYVLNIPSQIQSIWNGYLEAREEAEEAGTEIDYDSISGRSVYLGPTATDLYGMQYATLQAGDPTLNTAPMRLELTYTMIR